MKYPINCHLCGNPNLVLCEDNGTYENCYELHNGKRGELLDSELTDSEKPDKTIYCDDCEKYIYKIKIIKEFVKIKK